MGKKKTDKLDKNEKKERKKFKRQFATSPSSNTKSMLIKVALILLGVSLLWMRVSLWRSDPYISGELTSPYLKQSVQVSHDQYGVAHVDAQNMHDMFFAAGFETARQRLWQMYGYRNASMGQLSSYLGPDTIPVDKFLRQYEFSKVALKAYLELPAELQTYLISFANGVNEYINRDYPLPAEFRLTGYRPDKWQPQDSFKTFLFFGLLLSGNLTEEVLFLNLREKFGAEQAIYLLPNYPDEPLPLSEATKLPKDLKLSSLKHPLDTLPSLPHLEFLKNHSVAASNNWAVSPRRSKKGASLLAGDPHLGLSLPNSWIRMDLKSPDFHASGAAIPGVPIIAIGSNGKVAWSATMVMADNQDVFVEKLKTEQGTLYSEYKGSWESVQMHYEQIAVKGQKPVAVPIRKTRNGTLIHDLLSENGKVGFFPAKAGDKYGLAMANPDFTGDQSVSAFFDLMRSETAAQARAALQKVEFMAINVAFADKQSVGIQATGKYPLRRRGVGKLPSPGWTGEYEWVGYLPKAFRPGELNPARGYVASANHRLVRPGGPVLSNSYIGPSRFIVVDEALAANNQATLADMQALQYSFVSALSREAMQKINAPAELEKLQAAIGKLPSEQKQAASAGLKLLQQFNHDWQPNSPGAAMFGLFITAFTKTVFDELPVDDENTLWQSMTRINRKKYNTIEHHLAVLDESPFFDRVASKDIVETRADNLALAMALAYQAGVDEFGKDEKDWQWGKLHTYSWQHTIGKRSWLLGLYFNGPSAPSGGDNSTPNVAVWDYAGNYQTTVVPSVRILADFSLEEPISMQIHGGQSGNPESDHYTDQVQPWLENKLQTLPFTEAGIKKKYKPSYTWKAAAD